MPRQDLIDPADTTCTHNGTVHCAACSEETFTVFAPIANDDDGVLCEDCDRTDLITHNAEPNDSWTRDK